MLLKKLLTEQSLRRISSAAGILTIMIGLIVLIGRRFDIEFLKKIFSAELLMNTSTAVAFILAGFVLLFLQFAFSFRKIIIRLLASGVILVAMLSLVEGIFQINIGFYKLMDSQLDTSIIKTTTSNLALYTSVNFIFIGIAFVLLTIKNNKGKFILQSIIIFEIAISVIVFFSYVFGFKATLTMGAFQQIGMAFTSSITFIILGLGMLLTAYSKLQSPVTVEQKILAEITVSAIVIIFILFLTLTSLRSMQDNAEIINYKTEVREQTSKLLESVINVESGARGYVISGSDKYLEPMDKALKEIPAQLIKLRLQLKNNYSQQQLVAILDRLVKKRIDIAKQLYSIRKYKGLNSAVALLEDGTGKMLSDSIRIVTSKMIDAENDYTVAEALQKNILSTKNKVVQTQTVILIGFIVQLFMFGLMFIVVKRNSLKRKEAEDKLLVLNENLESAVLERTLDLRQSEEKYHKSFSTIPDPIFVTRKEDDEILEVNEAFVKTSGFALQEILGHTMNNLLLWVEQDQQQKYSKMIQDNGRVIEYEAKLRMHDGSFSDWLISSESVTIRKEECVLSIIKDITARKKAEEEIRSLNVNLETRIEERTAQLALINENLHKEIEERKRAEEESIVARAEAERANIAKSEFLSRMSHELRTPMNSILGFAQLMEMGDLNPVHKKGVKQILKSGKHLLELINEVLDIAKIEAGRLTLSTEPVEVWSVVQETVDIVSNLAKENDVTIESNISAVKRHFVKADHQRLKQVLLNLVNNAVKYNRKGGSVIIESRIQNELNISEQANNIRISITDTGKGITEVDLKKLFNPFERIAPEGAETEGTGLGLAISKKLVEAMGGKIGVVSVIGSGSTFWIELPQTESQIEQLERTIGVLKSEVKMPTVNGTILYIEDNISNIQLVEQILETHRPSIKLITNMYGKNAVPFAVDFKPNLILLDLDLPDIHGSKVVKLLHENSLTAEIPVIILSADAMTKQIERLLQSGVKDYLIKPIDVKQFLKAIDEMMIEAKKEKIDFT